MDCERKGCGHPLALHDPCSAPKCRCTAYQPADRKERVASITDVRLRRPTVADARAADLANPGKAGH